MSARDENKLNVYNLCSIYANYNGTTKLYDDRCNWGLPACYRCRFASDCGYYAHDPLNKSTCFRFKMEGDYRVDITMKKIPIDHVSENRYHNFVNGVIYVSDD